jgi:hypothetical protein
LRIRAIQEPVFSVANADFEGGGDDHGYGDYIFGSFMRNPAIVLVLVRYRYYGVLMRGDDRYRYCS